MSILSQTEEAKHIAENTNWQQLLEESFKEMNLFAGSMTETEEHVQTVCAKLSGYQFKVSLKIELEEIEDHEY